MASKVLYRIKNMLTGAPKLLRPPLGLGPCGPLGSATYDCADDLAFLFSHKCWNVVEEVLSLDMQRIADDLSAWRLRLSTAKTTCTSFHLNSGQLRKFPRGAKFCHNNVMSQSNFKRSAEDTTILGWSGGMPREIFSKLHLKIRICCAFWKEVLV